MIHTVIEAMLGYDFETGGWQSGAGHFTQVMVLIIPIIYDMTDYKQFFEFNGFHSLAF